MGVGMEGEVGLKELLGVERCLGGDWDGLGQPLFCGHCMYSRVYIFAPPGTILLVFGLICHVVELPRTANHDSTSWSR